MLSNEALALFRLHVERHGDVDVVVIRLTTLVLRDAEFLHPPQDITLANVLPLLGDLAGVQPRIGRAPAPRRGRLADDSWRWLLAHGLILASHNGSRNPIRPPAAVQRRSCGASGLFDPVRTDTMNGGGENCTRVHVLATHCPLCGYDLLAEHAQEMGREAGALRELVANWHRLTLGIREAVMELARGATLHESSKGSWCL
jgi:hypothetical protein